jgi:hypothetical protein
MGHVRIMIPAVWGVIMGLGFFGQALAQGPMQPGTPVLPFMSPFPATQAALPPNTVLPPMSREAKRQWVQLFMLFRPLMLEDIMAAAANGEK